MAQETFLDAITMAPVPVGGVLALGNFDGVHLGHQAVIEAAVFEASRLGAASYALNFEPHPYSLFQREKTPFLITSHDEKERLLRAAGAQGVVTLPFTPEFAALSPEAFIDRVLIGGCAVRHVVVGHDFVFGACRGGDRALLRARLGPSGVGVSEVPALRDAGGEIISSTRIRAAIRLGDPQKAAALLGRPFTIEGEVLHGDKRGRTLDFPTINMALGAYVRPLYGVYAVMARPCGAGPWRAGVANVGRRPTVGDAQELLETHLFDFNEEIYGQTWEVAFISFLRPEKKFGDLAALKAQMETDAAAARQILKETA